MASNTDDIWTFNCYMNNIKNVKSLLYQWLVNRDVIKWSLVNDYGIRYRTLTTDASECFNGVLKRAKGLPIHKLILAIYYNIV